MNAPRVTVLREIELITVTPPIRAQYLIQSRQGALVNSVSDRVQQQIGLQAGDVTVWADEPPKLLGNVSDLSAHRAKQVEVLDKESRGDAHR